MTQGVAIKTYAPGQPLPAGIAEQLVALFEATYLYYPYAHEIGASERFNLVALDCDKVLGYASFLVTGRYACCAHLLVASAARGRGLGRRLDHARYAAARSRGLAVYVSCLCEDVASQQLKLELGLSPVNVKFGHQVKSFVSSEGLGTALVFSEGNLSPSSPEVDAEVVDDRMRRVRIKLASGSPVPVAKDWEGWYLEVLVGPDGVRRLADDKRFVYAGLELDRAAETWHYCFQLANDVYHRGRDQEPALVCNAAAIAQRHPLPSA